MLNGFAPHHVTLVVFVNTRIQNWRDLLNALPIFLSVFMCHFNVLPVHNELADPTPQRVSKLFASSIWGACFFYLFVGFSGSMYGNCTPSGMVEGNVLLSFGEDDVLLMVGRACLSLTITAAFPILVVPCRDVILRALKDKEERDENQVDSAGGTSSTTNSSSLLEGQMDLDDNDLAEPLLGDEPHHENEPTLDHDTKDDDDIFRRRVASVVIFWTAAAVACSVESIDIVWDVLGGSLSLMMGFIIPSGSYIVLSRIVKDQFINGDGMDEEETGEGCILGSDHQGQEAAVKEEGSKNFNDRFARFLVILFVPMMFLLTGNAIYDMM